VGPNRKPDAIDLWGSGLQLLRIFEGLDYPTTEFHFPQNFEANLRLLAAAAHKPSPLIPIPGQTSSSTIYFSLLIIILILNAISPFEGATYHDPTSTKVLA